MDEFHFPTSPLALQAATLSYSSPSSPAFFNNVANFDSNSSSSSDGTFASPASSPRAALLLDTEDVSLAELAATSMRMEGTVRILTERLNFLDPEMEANASRIEVLEASHIALNICIPISVPKTMGSLKNFYPDLALDQLS